MATPNETFDILNVIKCVWCKGGKDLILMRLGCFHLGCKPCLQRHLVNVRNGSNFHCPSCDANCTKPEQGIEGFPLETLQSTVKDISDLVSNEYPDCSMCTAVGESTPSTHFCTTCHNHICTRDSKRHLTGNNHVLVTHAELKSGEVLSKIVKSKKKPCREHFSEDNQQFLTIFCKKCKTPGCLHCATLKHNDHDKVTVKEAAKEYKQKLKNKAAEINTANITVDENIRGLQTTLQDIEENYRCWIADFRKWGEDMKKTIDEIVEENVKKIENNSREQRRNVEEILKKETNKKKQFEDAGQYMAIVDQYGSDSEILDNFDEIIKDLKRCLEYVEKVDFSATRYVVKHVSVKESEKCLKELFWEVYVLQGFEEKTSWKAGCRYGVTIMDGNVLVLEGRNMELYGMNGEVKGQIECKELRNASNVEVFNDEIYVTDNKLREVLVMDENGRVKRRVRLPEIEKGKAGRLGLGLDRNNGDVYIASGGGKSVYKCKRGESTATPFITTGLKYPMYVCVTPQHECIVSDTSSYTVCKFSPSGQLMWEYGRYGSGVGQLYHQYGVCVDKFDHCFIADYNNQIIQYISPQGQFISYVDIQVKINDPIAITFSDDTLIITQRDATIRLIQCKYKSID